MMIEDEREEFCGRVALLAAGTAPGGGGGGATEGLTILEHVERDIDRQEYIITFPSKEIGPKQQCLTTKSVGYCLHILSK